VPDYLIPLNPPPVPKLIENGYDASFMRNFEEATNYILYAATACTRLRVNEEITRRSKLRWYSVLADLYDRYKKVVNQMPSLKYGDKRVKEASKLADEKKKDRLRRKALAKEVMAGRRINKILTALKGQWHVIELHDFINREFLINNDTEFVEKLVKGISWPDTEYDLPYKLDPNSGSMYQYALLNDNQGDDNHEEMGDEEMGDEEMGDEEMGDNNHEEGDDHEEKKENDDHKEEDEKMGDDNREEENKEMGDNNHEEGDEKKENDHHKEEDEKMGDDNREEENKEMGDNNHEEGDEKKENDNHEEEKNN